MEFWNPGGLHLLKHPFYRDWMEGKLSRETLRDYAAQYFRHVEAFPRYLEAAIAKCPDARARQVLAENLADENGTTHGTSHPELWLRFAEGVGAPRAEVNAATPRIGIRRVIDSFQNFANGSPAQALGSLYAYESQVPEVAHSKIEGLRQNYGIEDERTLSFFEVHKVADVAHREVLERLLSELAPEAQREAREAAEVSARALWDFLSDVHTARA